MTNRTPHLSTQTEIKKLVDRCGSYAKAAAALNLPANWKPVLSMVARGQAGSVSRGRENELRARLNLFPLGVTLLDRCSIQALRHLLHNRTEVTDELCDGS